MPAPRVCIVSLFLLVANSLGLSPSLLAQQAPATPLKSIDIGITRARVFPNSTGEYAVCVSAGWETRPGTATSKLFTKFATVDLKEMKVIARQEIPDLGARPVAVGKDAVYLATNAEGIIQLNLLDLQKVKQSSNELPGYSDLHVLGNELLFSSDGRLRLDLPELVRTQRKWVRPPYLSRDRADIRLDLIGWRIDNQIYDRDMKLLLIIPEVHLRDNPWWKASLYLNQVDSTMGMKLENNFRDDGRGVAICAFVPQIPSGENVPFTLRVQELDGGKVLAETLLGTMPTSLTEPFGGSFHWKLDLPRAPYRDCDLAENHGVVPINMIGDRVLVTLNDTLSIWDLDPEVFSAAHGRLFIVQAKPQVLVDYRQPTVIQHRATGGTGKATFDVSPSFPLDSTLKVTPEGEVTIAPSELMTTDILRQYLAARNLFQRSDVTAFMDQAYGPLFDRAFGRAPQGLPVEIPLSISAVDEGKPQQRVDMEYAVLTEVPEEVYGPLLKYQKPEDVPDLASRSEEAIGFGEQEKKQKMVEVAAKKAEEEAVRRSTEELNERNRQNVESQQREIQAGKARRERAEKAKQQDQSRPLLYGLALLISCGLVAGAMTYGAMYPPVVGETSIRGALLAGVALLPLLSIFAMSRLEENYGPPLNGAETAGARAIASAMIGFAFLSTAGLIWLGTVITVVDKGGSIVIGMALGMIAPLGLAIAILMPGKPFEPAGSRLDDDELERPVRPSARRNTNKK